MIFLTSDLYIGDKNDELIFSNYQKIVSQEDNVFFLGNLTKYKDNKSTLSKFISRLNGKKHLVLGNTDYYSEDFYLKECKFKSVNRYISTEKYVMVHSPYNFLNRDLLTCKILLHGFMNAEHPIIEFEKLTGLNGDYIWDVGIKANNYFPVSLEYIKEAYKKPFQRIRC